MKREQYIHYLIERFRNNTISKEEYQELIAYFDSEEQEQHIKKYIGQALQQEHARVNEQHLSVTLSKVDSRLQNSILKEKRKRSLFIQMLPYIAAATVLLIGFTFYHIRQKSDKTDNSQLVIHELDIPPGDNRATLVLADGSAIELSKQQAGITMSDGLILYKDGSMLHQESAKKVPLTLNTPKGGQYQITLSDGTKVWLNSASSLQYPSQFNKAEKRIVKLTGEAYFEVAKNKNQPFIVQSEQQEIQVLGTQFNINSYPDEIATKTTLKEGSVRVTSVTNNNSILLKPNQQSLIIGGTEKIQIREIDATMAAAWKEGYFHFEDLELEEILRVVSRWYGVTIKYAEDIGSTKFSGRISKNRGIRQVLNLLEGAGNGHFKIMPAESANTEPIVIVSK